MTAKTMAFGDLLRRFRRAAGLTQEELAERAGLSRRGITDLERGARQTPRRDTVALLIEALGLVGEERAAFVAAARRAPEPLGAPASSPDGPHAPHAPHPLDAAAALDASDAMDAPEVPAATRQTPPPDAVASVPPVPAALPLPSGTVTFVFTDIEGSTRLLQQLGAPRYAQVRAESERLLHAAVAAHDGRMVDTAGDGCFIAFARAADAVAAAAEAQRALAAHAWPAGAILRVRMGLHTGTAQVVGERYVGLDVHRAARIAAAGHGGQVLLSAATRELVEDARPDGAQLRDLGAHRLKDLQRPEHLFQLVLRDLSGVPDLLTDFPPLNTLERHAHNLPIQPTLLLGREREVAEMVAVLRQGDVRLLTLTGPGGVGKTRLGLQVAAELTDAYADGVWFARLSGLTDPELVLPTIAQTLGLRESGGQSLQDLLRDYVRTRTLLLLLDNFEQVVAAAPEVADLLASSPGVNVLVTSRVRLHLRGEKEYPLPPLALPPVAEPTQHGRTSRDSPEQLMEFAAVTLFLQRAQDVQPDFHMTSETAPAVAAICARLDGLPLALELAATRVKVLPPALLLQRLQRRLPLLTGGARDLPERQQTLRATLAWSEALLQPEERRLFRRLAVFVDSWTLEAAEAVCTAPAGVEPLGVDVLDGLSRLVDQSLVQQRAAGEEGGELRFDMLQVIREYALEQLEMGSEEGMQGKEAVALRRAHATYYLGLAEQAEPELRGRAQAAWLDLLERDHDNFRAALAWMIEEGKAEEAARLALALWPFWHARTYLREGQRWLEQVQALADRTPLALALRARLMNALGVLAHTMGHFDRADAFHGEAIRLWSELGDRNGLAAAVLDRGWQHFYQLHLQQAQACADESLALARQVGNRRAIAAALYLRAVPGTLPPPLTRHLETSLHDLEECLQIWRELGDTASVASALGVRALGEINRGQYERAKPLLAEALATHVQMGTIGSIGPMLWGLLQVAAHAKKQPEVMMQAAQLLGAVAAWGESQGVWVGEITSLQQATDQQIVTLAKDALGEEVFAREFAAGKRLALDAALALALAVTQPAPDTHEALPAAGKVAYPHDLTQREVEVLRLVAAGLSNPQIAQHLALSTRTVEAHLRAIFSKLAVTTRTAAARFALEHGLA